jgi:hypothetical protein
MPDSAVVNWIWISSSARRERVLVVTETRDGWTECLQPHFRRVERCDVASLVGVLPFGDGSFDHVLLPGMLGNWRRARSAAIHECRRLLCPGGLLLVSGANPQFYTAPSFADFTLTFALSRAGFGRVHRYFAEPSDNAPVAIFAGTRAAYVAYERQERATRGRARRLLATIGLHSVAYPARFILAYA